MSPVDNDIHMSGESRIIASWMLRQYIHRMLIHAQLTHFSRQYCRARDARV